MFIFKRKYLFFLLTSLFRYLTLCFLIVLLGITHGYIKQAEARTSISSGAVSGNQGGGVPRDSCNKVNFSYVENPSCQDLVFGFNQNNACQVINAKKKNNATSYSWSVIMRSNDRKAHTVTYSGATNFCNNGYKQLNNNGFCSCGDRQVTTQNTVDVPATGAISLTLTYPNPFGGVCGTWQMDFSVSGVDGNNNCGFQNNISSGTCETGTSCIGNNPQPTQPNQPPPPTATPTPLPRYSISGNVYVDTDKSKQFISPPDTLYSGEQSNFDIAGPTSFSFNSSTGTYTTGAKLPAGTYKIAYTSLPQTYYMTVPLNGPPPTYQVTVGPVCSTNGNRQATCAGGNINNLNFGVSNFYPWFQATCGDVRIDNGIIDHLPVAQTVLVADTSCTNPSVGFSGDTNPILGEGKISVPGELTGNASYPEIFSKSSGLDSSYPLLLAKARAAKLVTINLNSVCNITNCSLPKRVNHGLYLANGDVTLNAYNFPTNANYVFLINGNLTIRGSIKVPHGSTALFSTTKNIVVDSAVGTPPNNATASLEGWYIAGQNFIVNSQGNCNDLRLNIAGTVVVNALGTGGTFQNNRDLCANDAADPTVTFSQRLDMILNAPEFLKQQQKISQEMAP